MASFTDSVLQQTPYRQQLPIEAMTSVGTTLQGRYNEGIQKIQHQIEDVAGIDVARDIDKQYLQGRLNELGNNLKKVAAGDFSNFQLVNSVGGMAKQIIKDPNIQNAYASTQRYRSEVGLMNEARKKGESSPSNEWDFQTKANSWLSSKNLKESFNHQYTPYIDVSKKWMEVVKSLHSDLQDVDVAYETNPDGSPNYQKTLAAMQRISKESVSSTKIENALRANLSPTELNQLSIDGRYIFKDVDQNGLINHASSKTNMLISKNNEAIKGLEGYAKLNSSNSENLLKANSTISSLKEKNKQLQNQLQEEVSYIHANPEQAKAELYKNGAIEQFAIGHSWEHNKSNLLENPVQRSEQWERKFVQDKQEFDWKKFKDVHDMNLADREYQIKLNKSVKDTHGSLSGFTTYFGPGKNITDPKTAILNDIDSNITQASQIKNDIVDNLGGKVTRTQLDNALQKYQEGDSEEYDKVKASLPVAWRGEIDRALEFESNAGRTSDKLAYIEDKVKNSPKYIQKQQEIQQKLQQLPTLNIEGNKFSQSEINNYLLKRDEVLQNVKQDYRAFDSKLDAKLTNKEKLLNQSLQQYPDVKGVLNQYTSSGITEDYKNTLEDQQNEIDKELLLRGGTYIPAFSPIEITTDEAKKEWDSKALGILERFTRDESGSIGLTSKEREKAQNWLTGETKKDIQYGVITQNGEDVLVMRHGEDKVDIPLTSIESLGLPISTQRPSSEESKLTTSLTMGNGETNPSGDPMDAQFQRFSMPNISKLNVVADASSDKTVPGKTYLELKLKIGGDWVASKSNIPITKGDLIKVVNELTDEQVKKIYLQDPTVSREVKEKIASLK